MSPSARIFPALLVVSLLLVAACSVGCIRVGDLSRSAMRYNEAVEEAQNKMLLLNIVRAESFRPMYITDLTKFTGSIKLDINTGGIETDFGPYATAKSFLSSGKLTPSVDYAHNPTFDVNVLSNQEFMRGFTAPCTKDLLAYYWEQGWPPEFLLYLFVHHVHVHVKVNANGKDAAAGGSPGASGDTGKSAFDRDYENYPDPLDPNLKKLEDFGKWVTEFVSKQPRFLRKDVRVGPCLEKTDLHNLKDLVSASKEGLSVAEVGDEWVQLLQAKPELTLMDRESADKAEEKEKERQGNPSEICRPPGAGTEAGDKPAVAAGTNTQAGGKLAAVAGNSEYTLYLRSPEGILFYLGELMRVADKHLRDGVMVQKVPEICVGGHLWPLFVAFDQHPGGAASGCRSSSVSATYGERDIIIPDDPPDLSKGQGNDDYKCPDLSLRPVEPKKVDLDTHKEHHKYIDLATQDPPCFGGMSMESFSLVTQLIALQKSAKDVPSTSVIRAIIQ